MEALYHITTIGRLSAIARRGLGGGASQFQGYSAYSRGRTFLTDEDGVDFWAERVWINSEANLEPEEQIGGIPVLLMVDVTGLELEYDKAGSRDCRCDSYVTDAKIPPSRIWVWDGDTFVKASAFSDFHHDDAQEDLPDHFSVDEDGELLYVDFLGIPEGWARDDG